MKTYLSEMMSPEKKKKLVEAKYRSLPQRTFNEKLVDSLSASVREKYEEIDAWRARVLQHAEIFSETELTDLYQVNFGSNNCELKLSNIMLMCLFFLAITILGSSFINFTYVAF